jgi:hypothetical protein
VEEIMEEIRFKSKNQMTGEEIEVITSMEELEDGLCDGGNRCVGPCECWIEPDGVCQNGWGGLQMEALANM